MLVVSGCNCMLKLWVAPSFFLVFLQKISYKVRNNCTALTAETNANRWGGHRHFQSSWFSFFWAVQTCFVFLVFFLLPVDVGSGLLTAYPQIHRLRFDPGGLGPCSAA